MRLYAPYKIAFDGKFYWRYNMQSNRIFVVDGAMRAQPNDTLNT